MVEYIDNVIKATAGEDICLLAKAMDAFGDTLQSCFFTLFNDEEELFMVEGILNGDGVWEFMIPASATTGLKGRYWYCVCDETHTSLCFKCPIYLK